MKRTGLFTGIAVLAACFAAQASIVGYTNTFSADANTNGWVNVGEVAAVIGRVTTAYDYDDGNTNTYSVYAPGQGMTITGDGVLGDGRLLFNVQNATVRDEAIGYNLSGALEAGEKITFSGSICASGTAYSYVTIQLWDTTVNQLLAEFDGPNTSNSVQVLGYNNIRYAPVEFTFDYTATAGTAGHAVQIRFRENDGATNYDFTVDNVAVASVIPEPATLGLVIIGCAGAAMMRNYLTR